MNQRIVQPINHGLIELGISALDGEIDLFLQIRREIVNQTAKPFEGGFEGQHTDAHGVFAQCRRQPVDRLGYIQDVDIVAAACDLAQARLHGHQFTDQVDKLIELFSRDADTRCGALTNWARGIA